LVLTPICPHSLTHRPIVISDKQSLKVKVPADAESVMLTIDGQEVQELPSRCIVEVSKSKSKHVKLIANPQRTYFDTLKSKFTQGRRLF
ncbi:MAG: NAD(+) kinase, partial [Halobacteriovoraceae bacterium]|nr:NAD(+) kinase [Halobacteriovoraceae bacterium]